MKKMIIPILILLLLTGYTPYVEVNDLVIVDMIGLEKVNDKYLLTVNTIKEEKTDNATKSIYQVSTFEGNSLGSIFLKAKKINNKKAYYGHLKLVVFQSKLLDKEIINYFQKQFTQMNYLIVGTNNDIKSLFKKYDSSSKIIKEINKKRIDDANIYLSTFEDYLKDIVNKKRESTLPIISLDKGLTTTGLEVYQKNILIDAKQAKINYLLNNKLTSFHQEITINNNSYEVEFNNVKSVLAKDTVTIVMDISSSDINNSKKLINAIKKLFKKEINEFLTYQKDNNIKTTLVNPNEKINIEIKIGENNYDQE